MSWRLVEGVPLPDAVGGHPALDFCNTRTGWGAPKPKEYLRTPGVLALWARTNGLIGSDGAGPRDEPEDPGEPQEPGGEPEEGARERAHDALARALALREALYRCALGGTEPADWELVSREAALARRSALLVPGEADAPATWRLRPAATVPAAALAAVAIAAEDLLTSSLAAFVAACPGEGCGWLFADRRRRRRWCSMAACGNRAKARRYAERHGPAV
jgi:predicted RNA-binding Zn ribbon-like protein